MAAQAGADIIISVDVGSGSEDMQPIGGMRSKRFGINNQPIDITNSDSTGRWRQILGTAAVRSASISGTGVFSDDAQDAALVQAALNGVSTKKYTFLVPDFGTFAGQFFLSTCEYSGVHDGEVAYDMTWENAGAVTFTAVA